MRQLNILVGTLLAALAMAVAATGPSMGFVAGDTTVAQDVRSARPPSWRTVAKRQDWRSRVRRFAAARPG